MDTLILDGQRWNVLARNDVKVFVTRNGETRWIDAQ
jgi:hypothetical protein